MDERADTKRKLRQYKIANGILHKTDCDAGENLKLMQSNEVMPDDIFSYISEETGEPIGEYYRVSDSGLTDTEILQYLLFEQLVSQRKTERHVTFFYAFLITELISGVVLLFLSL